MGLGPARPTWHKPRDVPAAADDHWLVFATLALLAWVAFRLEEILICSCADAGGPTTAAALHWQRLVMPAVPCGILGCGIANFIGLAVARALSP